MIKQSCFLRIKYVKNSRDEHKEITGHSIDHYSVLGEEKLPEFKKNVKIIEKFNENKKKDDSKEDNKTVEKDSNKHVDGKLEDLMEQIYADLPEDNTPMGLGNIELNDENIEYYIGTKDIEYTEAIARESMVGAIAHSVILIRAEDDANIADIKKEIKENVDPRKWVCVGVPIEDVIIKNKGNLIIVIIVEDEVGRESIEKGFDSL